MPSPVGHVLGGIAAGTLVAPATTWRRIALYGLLGAIPDIDILLPIQHRGPTHSIAAAITVFGIVLMLSMRHIPARNLRLAAAAAAAYASHVLLDWLGRDDWAPRGLMALWPVTAAYYVSGLDVFSRVSREYWQPGFWRTNLIALVREILILGPVAALSLLWGRRRQRRQYL